MNKPLAKLAQSAARAALPSMNILRIAAAVLAGETVTIGATVFEFNSDVSTPTAGRVNVALGATLTAANAVDTLVATINAGNYGVRATEMATNEILIVDRNGGNSTLACTETMAGTNNAWAAAAMFGGSNAGEYLPVTVVAQRAANATDVALGVMRFPFNFTPLTAVATVRTSAGVFKAWDGVTSISGNVVSCDIAGSADFAAGDLVTVTATG